MPLIRKSTSLGHRSANGFCFFSVQHVRETWNFVLTKCRKQPCISCKTSFAAQYSGADSCWTIMLISGSWKHISSELPSLLVILEPQTQLESCAGTLSSLPLCQVVQADNAISHYHLFTKHLSPWKHFQPIIVEHACLGCSATEIACCVFYDDVTDVRLSYGSDTDQIGQESSDENDIISVVQIHQNKKKRTKTTRSNHTFLFNTDASKIHIFSQIVVSIKAKSKP